MPGSQRRRLPRLLLLVGIALAVVLLLFRAPQSRQVTFRIERPADLARLHAVWLSEERTEQVLAGSEWSFEPGTAPRLLRTTLTVDDGRYRLHLRIERFSGPAKEHERTIHFGAGESQTTIVVD